MQRINIFSAWASCIDFNISSNGDVEYCHMAPILLLRWSQMATNYSENVEESQSHKMHLAYIKIHPLAITLIKWCYLVENIMKFPSKWVHRKAVTNDKISKRCWVFKLFNVPFADGFTVNILGVKIAMKKKLFAQKVTEFVRHLNHENGCEPRCGAVKLTLGCGCPYLFALC